jgi:hypothetical protein
MRSLRGSAPTIACALTFSPREFRGHRDVRRKVAVCQRVRSTAGPRLSRFTLSPICDEGR